MQTLRELVEHGWWGLKE